MDHRLWDERYAAAELIWTAEPNRFLVAEVNGLAPGRALDLACGEGRDAVWLAAQGWEVTGVDFSRVALDKAHHLAQQHQVRVVWILADVTTYRPPPPGFDLVAIFYLQLPAEPLAAALGNAVRALAPGGTLLLVGHDASNLARGYGGPQDPAVLYSPDDIVTNLDGLVIDKAERVPAPRPDRPRNRRSHRRPGPRPRPTTTAPGMTGRRGRQRRADPRPRPGVGAARRRT
jgi:SAM-dependent methyltransferase